jgi:malate dehydrogenase (oxaloacetate-decarboxylating)(NADP+)
VLGLGNIGALAGKPVMEGKGVLFKAFADIDVFDIEVKADSTAEFITTVKNIAPTFGGINLEDIAAPACFEIEQALMIYWIFLYFMMISTAPPSLLPLLY